MLCGHSSQVQTARQSGMLYQNVIASWEEPKGPLFDGRHIPIKTKVAIRRRHKDGENYAIHQSRLKSSKLNKHDFFIAFFSVVGVI
jgi:hypothetical protein